MGTYQLLWKVRSIYRSVGEVVIYIKRSILWYHLIWNFEIKLKPINLEFIILYQSLILLLTYELRRDCCKSRMFGAGIIDKYSGKMALPAQFTMTSGSIWLKLRCDQHSVGKKCRAAPAMFHEACANSLSCLTLRISYINN